MQRRVVVGVSGSLGSLTALHRATAEAQKRNAELYAVLAWQLPGGGLGSRATYGTALLGECREAARDDLCTALDTAFAAGRPGVTLVGCTVRGDPGAVLVNAVRWSDDLLVVGTGIRGRWFPGLRAPVARHCLAHAPCPVLAVPPNPLEAEIAAVRRRTWSPDNTARSSPWPS
ncbi:universal stress protein [[Kitasatospora] papulosa]|uniref:universal stress protein n=1 Tax=Streptomyces TaxID=1883 RepID=UPI000996D23F|nr:MULTISPECIES: universal stress protein [Streptomyces]MCY1649603.1 universal stress protein [Streptomyces sp. SL203]MDF6060465.1 universal stress protein [Streptomyces sp. JH010]WSZ46027.1 universal stress protein [[Kitasatospora] papulosa]